MKTTEQDEFAAAFGEAPDAKAMPMDDEVFGTDEVTEADVEMAEDEPTPASTETPEEVTPAMEEAAMQSEASAEPEGADVAVVIAPETPAAEDGATDPKDIQRQKSWEGRLKAKEAELKAWEERLKAGNPQSAEDGESTESAPIEALETAVAAVDSGDMTVDQAMQALSADFGPEFPKMLSLLVKASAAEVANETVGGVRQELDGLVGELVEDKKRMHTEMISDAHPDFVEVAGSPEFRSWVEGLPEDKQAAAVQVIEAGSARQIIKLLNDFKGGAKPAEEAKPDNTQAMDAAEGVRSAGMKLPVQPAKSEDYASAWDQF